MNRKRTRFVVGLVLILTLLLPGLTASPVPARKSKTEPGLQKILQYISKGWNTLSRSLNECGTFSDSKTTAKTVLYLPADLPISPEFNDLRTRCGVQVKHLPRVIEKLGTLNPGNLQPPGLLYLPKPYVVPGGRFNEMYGWDSYFIIRGLIEDGRLDLARDIVENFFFEIDHYGGVLNANRTYYLTRSQPPFLTSMIRAVYQAEQAEGKADRAWLAKAYPYAVKDYQFWTSSPHLAGTTGLSRYYGLGNGPVPELGASSTKYYEQIVHYFLSHPAGSKSYLMEVPKGAAGSKVMGPKFSLVIGTLLRGKHSPPGAGLEFSLTPAFYKGDRSMRESGFDISFRFGPFGASTPDFAAVGLNSLLYKSEKDLEWMSEELGLKQESMLWAKRADKRQAEVNRYLWDPGQGLYYDYSFINGARSSYTYATTFYPLWTGLASPAQARAVVANLRAFEEPGGIVMSLDDTGAQWDSPYGWAPIQLIAVEGLRRYGYRADADRISLKFLSVVLADFLKQGTIREKYNVISRSGETQVRIGYKANVVGFGWTNGVFLSLLHALPKADVALLTKK